MDNNIALQVQTPDAMKNIGSMLGIANSAQKLQQGNVELEKHQIMLQERKGIQDLFRNPKQFTGEDGTPDYNKLIEEGMKVAPTTFPAMVPQIISAHKSSIEAKAALNTLNESQRASVGQYVMSLANDDPPTARKKLDALVETQPQLKPAVDMAWRYHLQPNENNPEGWKNAALKVGQSVMAPTAQASAITPSYVGTGSELKQTNPLAAASGAPDHIANTVAPSGQEVVETDALGNKYVVTRAPSGAIVNTRPMPGSGQGEKPKSFASFGPGDREAIPVLQKERDEARTVLLAAPVAHATNRGVLQEIDHVSATGVTGPAFQKLNSALGGGLDFSTPEKKASSYDLVGKYLERNALNAAASMGPQTNAYLEAQIKANGSLGYNPTAIKKITKLNDAIVSGSEAYQPGLEKAIAADPNKGVLAKREYDQAWAQNFDPLVMQLHNAQKDGDKSEIADIIKSLGGKDSARSKELVRKARNIEKLSTTGSI